MNSEKTLLIDIGNTNLKWSLLQNGRLSPVAAVPHKVDSVELLAQQCWDAIDCPAQVYLANVAGQALEQGLSDWMELRWHKAPQIIHSESQALGVTNGYHHPLQLGVDRWLTLLAVRASESGMVCIVDCGTAITIDLMTTDGMHRGGMILPGLNLMRESLLRDTNIPRVKSVEIEALFAHDTAAAVASAALHSAAALIERCVQEAASLYKSVPKLILTGSDARLIAEVLHVPYSIDGGLVMKGLALLAESEGGKG
ncbi:MAG: type III pantothenate kinase [Sedimenticola thiotaurini]|uniref:Type III pantothenate kinase n=1 Tax=Sedimenticola thiotaurini TaxID=1543721 RepID=A0A558CP87_9GAMM|nr:MAG: type III pantothenate kinase [Sedimenticola thiotaurini]